MVALEAWNRFWLSSTGGQGERPPPEAVTPSVVPLEFGPKTIEKLA